MDYEGAVKIDKRDPQGNIMDVGFVVNYAFDKRGMSLPLTDKENKENSILEAIQKESISSAYVEMRALNPKASEGTYLYNEETNIKDKNGKTKYRHIVQFSGKQLCLVYKKGQDAVLQNENKSGIQRLMLGCKCKVGEVANTRDAQKLKEWKANGADPAQKPNVRSSGLYPRFNAESTFCQADKKLTPNTLEELDEHEKKFWTKLRRLEKEKLMKELENSFEKQKPTKEKGFQYRE